MEFQIQAAGIICLSTPTVRNKKQRLSPESVSTPAWFPAEKGFYRLFKFSVYEIIIVNDKALSTINHLFNHQRGPGCIESFKIYNSFSSQKEFLQFKIVLWTNITNLCSYFIIGFEAFKSKLL